MGLRGPSWPKAVAQGGHRSEQKRQKYLTEIKGHRVGDVLWGQGNCLDQVVHLHMNEWGVWETFWYVLEGGQSC